MNAYLQVIPLFTPEDDAPSKYFKKHLSDLKSLAREDLTVIIPDTVLEGNSDDVYSAPGSNRYPDLRFEDLPCLRIELGSKGRSVTFNLKLSNSETDLVDLLRQLKSAIVKATTADDLEKALTGLVTKPAAAISSSKIIVCSLHGIRTRGKWQKDLNQAMFAAGLDYRPLDYGFFRAVRLLWPPARRKQVDWFREQYELILLSDPNAVPSVIAHSFGTYLVARALEIIPEIRLGELILCGSIVRKDFPWTKFIHQDGRVRRVLNQCGLRDIWSGTVRWFIEDAGPSGAKGFDDEANGCVIQQKNPEFRHSDYFYSLNYKNNWIPFLKGTSLTSPVVETTRRPFNWRFALFVLFIILSFMGGLYSFFSWRIIEPIACNFFSAEICSLIGKERISQDFTPYVFHGFQDLAADGFCVEKVGKELETVGFFVTRRKNTKPSESVIDFTALTRSKDWNIHSVFIQNLPGEKSLTDPGFPRDDLPPFRIEGIVIPPANTGFRAIICGSPVVDKKRIPRLVQKTSIDSIKVELR